MWGLTRGEWGECGRVAGGMRKTWNKFRASAIVREDARHAGLLMTVAGAIGLFLEPSGMLVESSALLVFGLLIWIVAVRASS